MRKYLDIFVPIHIVMFAIITIWTYWLVMGFAFVWIFPLWLSLTVGWEIIEWRREKIFDLSEEAFVNRFAIDPTANLIGIIIGHAVASNVF